MDDDDDDAFGDPLAALQKLSARIPRVALSHEEMSALRTAALQLAAHLQVRQDAMPLPDFNVETPFRVLQGLDELRLVTDLVPKAESLCIALACRKLRDAVFAHCPRDEDGWRVQPSVDAHVSSVSRLHWAMEVLDMPIGKVCNSAAREGSLDVLQEARRLRAPWDSSTCAAAAEGGHVHVLQWLRGGDTKWRCPWDEDTCAAAARGGHVHVLRWVRQRKCPWDQGTCLEAATHGQLAALQWARKNACPWHAGLLEDALAAGQFETFMWAQQNGLSGASPHNLCSAVRPSAHLPPSCCLL